jgi:hypothetical protein
MEEKARQRFLIKLSYQGFLIEDLEESLVLKPRGYAEPAEVIITEDEPNHWVVTGAAGAYGRYYHGKHRAWFETLINGLAFQAAQEVLG